MRLWRRPAVGEVQVREEQNPAAEEREEHDDAVDLVQQSVLLLILKETGRACDGAVANVNGIEGRQTDY